MKWVVKNLWELRVESSGLREGLAVVACGHGAESYRGADKSLVRPGRKQATATEDFEFHIPYL